MTEIVVTIFIISLLVAPIFRIYRSSSQTMIASRGVADSTIHALSLLSLLKTVSPEALKPCQGNGPLPEFLNGAAHRLPPLPKGYERTLELSEYPSTSHHRTWAATVTVSWRREGSDATQEYRLATLLDGGPHGK